MDKLTVMRLSADWEAALVAALPGPPPRKPRHRVLWLLAGFIVLAGITGVTVWFAR
ncbi:hypothetical protein [Luteibacter sp. ME-Dv--P-043b]|jgi:hypothetical protein|uniref:hypothetical protein n=1 Tax=unclassified Luteibacter TaxID=2620188 RepID=UPI002556309D|nr:hypothetical protein [Luteibacter sp. ME-Dv--P-043b]